MLKTGYLLGFKFQYVTTICCLLTVVAVSELAQLVVELSGPISRLCPERELV